MAKTTILLRCTHPDFRTIQQYELLRESLPGVEIVAIPDMTDGVDDDVIKGFEEAGIDSLPVTEEFLTSAGLEKAGARTGWVCGDYVFLRALERSWDFAWVVEPDVHFLNGSEQIISRLRLQGQHQDLVGTYIWPASPGWRWHAPLMDLGLVDQVYAMAFPFVRISRQLAEDVLAFRKTIAKTRTVDQETPNDESVVSTVAHAGDYTILDLSKLMPDMFKYWSTVTRHNIDDIVAEDQAERIIHSGRSAEEFHQYINSQVAIVLEGSEPARTRILRSLESSSPETVMRVLSDTLSAAAAQNRT